MRTILSLMTLSAALTSFAYPIVTEHSHTASLVAAKKNVEEYVSSGCYNQQLTEASNKAIAYLKARIHSNEQLKHPKKLAIVFDIDETTLSNYPYMKSESFGFSPKPFSQHICQANDPALKPIRKLYNFAINHGVAVFFITGRRSNLRKPTILNLKTAGYHHWQGIYFKPMRYHESSAIPYKAHARKLIEKQGFDIALSMGDQYSDSLGGYADRGYKLPDPFYSIP